MTPMSAQDVVVCDMVGGSSMSSMTANDTMSDMSCDMHEGVACNSIQCVNSCVAVPIVSLVSSDSFTFTAFVGQAQIPVSPAFFYNIVHPIYTPPPLV